MLFEDAEIRINPTLIVLAEASPLWWAEGGHRPVDVAAISFLDGKGDILTQIYGTREEGLRVLHIVPALAADWGVAAYDLHDAEVMGPTWQIITNSCRAEQTALPSLMGPRVFRPLPLPHLPS
jgi:hypothetical protein